MSPSGANRNLPHGVWQHTMTPLSPPTRPKFVPWQFVAAMVAASAAALSSSTCDMAVARWFSTVGLPGDLRRLISASEVFAYGGSVACIILTAMVLDSRRYKLGLWLFIHALGAGLIADLCKLILARQRPYAADLAEPATKTFGIWLPSFMMEKDYGAAWQAMPSGHTATAVGLAIALSAAYPRGRWLFAIFAVMAAAQRLQASAHFLSDVLAAAALALLWSLILERIPRLTELIRTEETSPAAH